MLHFNIYRTGKLFDQKIINLLEAIEKEFGCHSTYVRINNIEIDYKAEENKKLFKSGFSITRGEIWTNRQKFNIKFLRGIGKDANNPEQAREASAYFDEIVVTFSKENPPHQTAPLAADAIKCDEIIRSFITNVIPSNIEDGANNATNLLQAQIASLAEQYQAMLTGIDARRAELDTEHKDRMALLETQATSKITLIEEQRKKEEQKLQQKKDALDTREKALDNRDHMHVRREQREKITEEVKERLKKAIVSPSAKTMRLGVLVMSLAAAVFLALISIGSLFEIHSLISQLGNKEPQATSNTVGVVTWFLIIKSVLASLGAVGALFYAISWLRHIYVDDVSTERQLERYAYDINRASWAIETIMEMQITKGTHPPQTWIDATCNNLFEGNNKDKEIFNPVEALLNSSAKVELGPDGTKFELGSKGAKKLAKKL